MRNIFLLTFLFAFQVFAQAGTITLSSASLFGFGNCAIYHTSDAQRYTLSATALSNPLFIQAPAHFEVSLSYNAGYSNQIQINPVSGNIATTTIFIRFSPYLSGAFSGSINHVSVGSTSQTKSVSGTGLTSVLSSTTYYNTISTTTTGASLKTALYNKILGHTVTAYGSGSSGLWATYSTTDPFYNGKVWDIYSTRMDANSPFEFTFSVDQCGTYSVEGDCYNREHSFPQSWFTSSSPMVSDMYHIYPTDGKVNGMRNNYPFGEVSSPTYTSLQGGKLGPNTTAGYTGITFEPIDDYKGDLARSFFYMATRYENLIAGWQSNGNANDVLAGNAFPAYDAWFLNLLVKWHNQDPPGAKEINRNNAVFGYQNNRNPFIDSPQYVNRIWGGAIASQPTVAATNFNLMNFTSTTATIGCATGNGKRRLIIARMGAPVNALPADSLSYTANAVFGSGQQIGTGNYVVYNGMGASVLVSGLNQNLTYHFLVVEYNGFGRVCNYLTTSTLASGVVALPVEWLNFSGQQVSPKEISLHWTTASETNNKEFSIERWLPNQGFVGVGKVAGNGTTSSMKQFSFTDVSFYTNPGNTDVELYRLRQTDFDGKFSYSDEITVDKTLSKVSMPKVVNPTEENGLRVFSDTPQETEIVLCDLSGKIIFQTKTTLSHETFIPFESELPAGMYVLHLVQRSGKQTYPIIKR